MPVHRDKKLTDSAIAEMEGPHGLSIVPEAIVIGHGYHPETGADVVTFGGVARLRCENLLTMVMSLETACEARDLLTEQIELIDQLNAARPNGEDTNA